MTLTEIKALPTIINNTHESVYRVYHVLDKVMEMINRGDTKETIIEVVNFLSEERTVTTKCGIMNV